MQEAGKTKWYQNENGAIDLASIMVGIIVIGLIGGTIAATVFAVIPWAQDNAAKQQLGSIVQAENAYMGLSSTVPSSLPSGLASNSFAGSADLETAGLLKSGTTYCASTANTGSKGYEGYAKSSSGALFTVSDKNTSPLPFNGPLPADCAFLGASVSTPAPYVDPTPSLTSLTYQCATTQSGTLPWQANLTGKETWDDGTTPVAYNGASQNNSKTLIGGKTYKVTFEGTYTVFSSANSNLRNCLISMDHWGSDVGVINATNAFASSVKLTSVPEHIPKTITNMYQMFYKAEIFNNGNISKWDVSNVTTTYAMFREASAFNQPLNDWNTANVNNMDQMFYLASNFNQPIDNWDTSSTTNMSNMFRFAAKFNQNIKMWDVTKVSNYTYFRDGSALTAANSPFG